MPSRAYLAEYCATDYVIKSPEGALHATIGVPIAFQKAPPHTLAHLITAYNPGSVLTADNANQRAHEALYDWIQKEGFLFWRTEAIDPTGAWPVEPGFFIWGLTEKEAHQIARDFGQNAWVAFHPTQDGHWLPILSWTTP